MTRVQDLDAAQAMECVAGGTQKPEKVCVATCKGCSWWQADVFEPFDCVVVCPKKKHTQRGGAGLTCATHTRLKRLRP